LRQSIGCWALGTVIGWEFPAPTPVNFELSENPLHTDKQTDRRTDDNHDNSSTVTNVRSAKNALGPPVFKQRNDFTHTATHSDI